MQWQVGPDERLRRRAWIVLEDLAGTDQRELAAATGMTSRRIAALVRAFREIGIAALVDAPRSGRPSRAVSVPLRPMTSREVAATLSISVDRVWREARVQGRAIERSRSILTRVACPGGLERLVALHRSPGAVALFVLEQNADTERFAPEGLARLVPERWEALEPLSSVARWAQLMNPAPSSARRATPRAIVESRQWLKLKLLSAKPPASPRLRLLIGGESMAKDFLAWLCIGRDLLESDRIALTDVQAAPASSTWLELLAEAGLREPHLATNTWPEPNCHLATWYRPRRTATP